MTREEALELKAELEKDIVSDEPHPYGMYSDDSGYHVVHLPTGKEVTKGSH